MNRIVTSIFRKLGYDVVPAFGLKRAEQERLREMGEEFIGLYEKCKDFTMTSIERMYALYQAVTYVVNSEISGDFVECGVWRGGSSMMIAHTLLKLGRTERKIRLYDTFIGMPEPTEKDKLISTGIPALDILKSDPDKSGHVWALAPIDEVRRNMLSTGYPEENIIFIQGKVEDTIPEKSPARVSLLRLDTDWYESTYHELKYIFPLISNKGVIIIDDYGHWAGSKEATDKYFSENKIPIFLNRIDYSGRIGIKTN